MNAFTRSNLACAERELRKCIANLEAANGELSLHEHATRVSYALREAQNALEEIGRAVRLDEGTEAA